MSTQRRFPAFVLATASLGLALIGACDETDVPRAGQLPAATGGVAAGGTTNAAGSGGQPSGGTAVTGGTGGGASGGIGGIGGSGGGATGEPSCGDPPAPAGPFSKRALLEATASCTRYQLCPFEAAAKQLESAVLAWVADPTGPKLESARAAFRTAMDRWQRLELFQFGPQATKSGDPYQGLSLRSYLHPWPANSRCQVETQILNKGYATNLETVLPNARGLDALEYVLFYEGEDSSCLPSSAVGQGWAALSSADRAAGKRAYAAVLARDVSQRAADLQSRWATDGGNFGAKLVAAEGYGSEQEALNVVAWGLVYVEKELKDFKVAPRAGVQDAILNPETPFALREVESMRQNLAAFRQLFQGCAEGAGLGFDDWLKAAGADTLEADMLAALDAVEAAAATFPPFQSATQPQLQALYDKLRALTVLLKASFFGSGSPLNLRLPAGAASDTD